MVVLARCCATVIIAWPTAASTTAAPFATGFSALALGLVTGLLAAIVLSFVARLRFLRRLAIRFFVLASFLRLASGVITRCLFLARLLFLAFRLLAGGLGRGFGVEVILGGADARAGAAGEGVVVALGHGDDAAVVEVPAGDQLVISMDTLVGGIHFPLDTSPADIAYKALAVNLSDLAAMAANPAWFLLSLTLPQIDSKWLSQFANELRQTAELFKLRLIGGDTCRGELSITIQIAGLVSSDQYLTRQRACLGDLILVSGELGNAALGLAHKQGQIDLPRDLQSKCLLALNRPQPRLELTPFLREFASAAIDISDGLQGDLAHVLKASNCGARISRDAIPVNTWIEQQAAYQYALAAGDDYEICCCVPARHQDEIENWNLGHPACQLTTIGEITESGYFLREGERLIDLGNAQGYRHFD